MTTEEILKKLRVVNKKPVLKIYVPLHLFTAYITTTHKRTTVKKDVKKACISASLILYGVTDGARTHDHRNHNPGLYQLSYSHHGVKLNKICRWRARQESNL